MLRNIYLHKESIKNLIVREFRARYIGSMLGFCWNVLQPLFLILIYTIVFSKIMGMRLNIVTRSYGYSVYLCAGLLAWTGFAELLSRSSVVYLENANLIKRIAFPSEIFNISILVTSYINLLINFGLFFIVIIILGYPISFSSLLIFIFLILQQLFVFGIGWALSVLNVFFRDIAQLIAIVIPLWFWVTPIVYVKNIIPAKWSFFLTLNPMYYFVDTYQNLFLKGQLPDGSTVGLLFLFPVITCLIGYFVFHKLRYGIPDNL